VRPRLRLAGFYRVAKADVRWRRSWRALRAAADAVAHSARDAVGSISAQQVNLSFCLRVPCRLVRRWARRSTRPGGRVRVSRRRRARRRAAARVPHAQVLDAQGRVHPRPRSWNCVRHPRPRGAGHRVERGRDRHADGAARPRALDGGLVLARCCGRGTSARPATLPSARRSSITTRVAGERSAKSHRRRSRAWASTRTRHPLPAGRHAPVRGRARRRGMKGACRSSASPVRTSARRAPGGPVRAGRHVGRRHGSIYPFENLRRACACGACVALEAVAPAMTWPRHPRTDAGWP